MGKELCRVAIHNPRYEEIFKTECPKCNGMGCLASGDNEKDWKLENCGECGGTGKIKN